MQLSDLIIEITKNLLKTQSEDGSFPAGCNGPYNDNDTSVRNTSHVLILLSNCYKLTNDKIFLNGIFKAANYLSSEKVRPFNFSFHCRSKEGKDKCNGLVGQAWALEALSEASKVLQDEKYLVLAEEIIFKHNFNYNEGLWQSLEINGEQLGVDKTFNHQLWFAASASLIENITGNIELSSMLESFLKFLPYNIKILDSGLIFHSVKTSSKKENKIKKKKLKNILRKKFIKIFHKVLDEKKDPESKLYRSIGYHSFNMCAFSILKEITGNSLFLESEEFKKTINYMLTEEYKNDLDNNIYGYPYNCSGFEIPFALNILGNFTDREIIEISKYFFNEQIQRCYNKNTGMMDKNTYDPWTLTARTYEIFRLPLNILEKISIDIF